MSLHVWVIDQYISVQYSATPVSLPPQEENPTPSELVSLPPKSVVELANNGAIVTVSPLTTPSENMASLRRLSLGNSPTPEEILASPEGTPPCPNEGDSPDAQEVASDTIPADSALPMELVDGATVSDHTHNVDVGNTLIASEGAPVITEDMENVEPSLTSDPTPHPVEANKEVPLNNEPPMDEEAAPLINEPLIPEKEMTEPLPMEQITPASESPHPHHFIDPILYPNSVDSQPHPLQQEPLSEKPQPLSSEPLPVEPHPLPVKLLVEEPPTDDNFVMPSGNIDTTLVAFNSPVPDDQSHDQLTPVSSTEQLKVRSKSRGSRKKKKNTQSLTR